MASVNNLKGDILSSDKGLMPKMSAFKLFTDWPFYVIDPVDNNVTLLWNDLYWNNLTIDQSDQLPNGWMFNPAHFH